MATSDKQKSSQMFLWGGDKKVGAELVGVSGFWAIAARAIDATETVYFNTFRPWFHDVQWLVSTVSQP